MPHRHPLRRLGARPVLAGLLALVAVLLVPAIAPGLGSIAEAVPTAPRNPAIDQSPPKWLGLLVMAVLFVPIIFVSIMPSKRSHQD